MKKIFLTMMAAALLVVGLTACGGKDKYPFEDLASLYSEIYEAYQNDPDLFANESKAKAFEDKRQELCKNMCGKHITAEVEEGLGFELVSGEAEMGECRISFNDLSIPVNFNLKVIDANAALENVEKLMAVLYDDEGNAVYSKTYITAPSPLLKKDESPEDDYISEVIDSVVVAQEYNNGQILKKGFPVYLKSFQILLMAKVSKLVIEREDYEKSKKIEDHNREWLKTTIRELEEKAAAKKTESGADGQKGEEASVANDVTPNAEPGRGDLGAYDLRGPVKKVIYDGWNCTFNEQGQLLTIDGQSLKTIYPGGITRDKNGRLKDCNADGYGSCSYNYNSKGLPTEIYADGCGRVLTYDADGYLKTETCSYPPEMGDEEGEEEVVKYTYTILEKDSYGNWTKRKDQNGAITTRKITYF